MLTDEETDPKTKRAKPRDLNRMSVAELGDYVQDLEGEIVRVKGELSKKQHTRAAADALFGAKKGDAGGE